MTVPQAPQSPQRPAHLVVRQPHAEHSYALVIADLGIVVTTTYLPAETLLLDGRPYGEPGTAGG
jgi:hypothetical protein